VTRGHSTILTHGKDTRKEFHKHRIITQPSSTCPQHKNSFPHTRFSELGANTNSSYT